MKRRIAVVDLLFSWPPDSGARIDLKEILQRMQADYDVRTFVLDYTERPFAGKIKENLPFPVEVITADKNSYHSLKFLSQLRERIQKYSPDMIFIADSWHMKPYLVQALKGYPKLLRFYCYETLCLKKNGVFTYRKKMCTRNHLESRKDFWFCQWCSLSSMIRHKEKVFWDEYIASKAYLPSYPRKVRQMYQESDGVICYNSFIAERIKPWNNNVHIIPSGVDIQRYTYRPFPETEEKKILFTGRAYDYFKGLHTLLEAGRILFKKRKDFRFLCTNEGKGIKEDFWELIPWSKPEDIPDLYSKAHICVVPSIWPEPFGIVAIEAMAAGRPVIASRVGGLQNIISDGEDGYLVPSRDENALAEKINYLLDNLHKAQIMGEQGRKKVEKHFSWDKIYEQYYPEMIEKICQK